MFYHFLWNGKGDKINTIVMINDPRNGGLKIDLYSFNKSLKTTWVKKYLDTTNKGKWKLLFRDMELGNYGCENLFRGNLNVNDTKKIIKVMDPVLKEILLGRNQF